MFQKIKNIFTCENIFPKTKKIEKIIENNDFVYETHTYNKYYMNNDNYLLERVPLINFGRAAGHTTAISNFIKHNPNLNVLVVTLTPYNFRSYKIENYLTLMDVEQKNYSSIRYKEYDYIIIDTAISLLKNKKFIKNFSDELPKIIKNKNDVRIICLGT